MSSSNTLSLKIKADKSGFDKVKEVLTKVENVMLQSNGIVKSFGMLKREMGGLKVQSAELKGELSKLHGDLSKTKETTDRLTSSERNLRTENSRLLSENSKLSKSNGRLDKDVSKLTAENLKLKKSKDKVATSTRKEIGVQQSLHSALRGTAGALGGLWLSYGRLLPMIAAFSEVSGLKKVIEAGSEFQFQMSFIQAISGESADSIARINDELLTMSRESVFAPNEMAKGLRILTQSGIEPAVAGLKTLHSVLGLAILGEFSMSEAATTVQTAMHAFNISVSGIPHAVDSITEASFLAATNVREMSSALANAAQVGNLYGVSLDETNALLATMAKSHLVGAKAGTALVNMMRDLAPRSTAAADAYKKLGVEIYDSKGNMRPVISIFGDLSQALSKYDKQSQQAILKTLQNRRGIRAMAAILPYATNGLLRMYSAILLSSEGGSTAEKAVTKLRDTVQGDMRMIKSHIEEGMIKAFRDSSKEIRDLSSSVRSFVSGSGFRDFLSGVVSGSISVIEYIKEHRHQIASLAKAYLSIKVATVTFGMLGGMFSGIVSSAGAAAKAVGTLSGALLGLKLANPILFTVAAAISAVAAKTLTSKDELSRLGSSVKSLSETSKELVGIDVPGWLVKIWDKAPGAADAVDLLNKTLVNSTDSAVQLKLMMLEKQRKSVEDSLRNGYRADIPNAADADRTKLYDIDAKIARLKKFGSLSERLAKKREDRARLSADRLDSEQQRRSIIAAKELADDAERARKVTELANKPLSEQEAAQGAMASKSARIAAAHDLENRLLSINDYYNNKISAAEKKFMDAAIGRQVNRAQAYKHYIDVVADYEKQRNIDIAAAKEGQKAGTKKLRPDTSSTDLANEVSISKKKIDVISSQFKQESELLRIHHASSLDSEDKYYADLDSLRNQKYADELKALQAHRDKLVKLRGEDKESKQYAKVNKQISSTDSDIAKITTESKNASEISRANSELRDYNKTVQAATALDKTRLALMSDKERAAKKSAATFDTYRESVDSAETAGIISLEEEIKLLDIIDEKENKLKPPESLLTAMKKGAKTYSKSLKGVYADLQVSTGRVLKDMESALTKFISTGKLSFKDLADSIITELARIEARKLMANTVSPLLDADVSGLGTMFGGGLGGGMNTGAPVHVGAGGTTAFGMASGGWADPYSVHPVNELGPELLSVGGRDYLMMGSQGGRVTPNNQIKSNPGGGDIIIQQTIEVDARNATPGMETAIHDAVAKGAEQGYHKVLSDVRTRGPVYQRLRQ